MARKKTKSQKQKTAQKRQIPKQKHKKPIKTTSPKIKSASPVENLFEYQPSLIVNDLVKTVILSVCFFILLIFLYIYLKSS